MLGMQIATEGQWEILIQNIRKQSIRTTEPEPVSACLVTKGLMSRCTVTLTGGSDRR